MQLPSSDPCLLVQECVTEVSRVFLMDIFNNLKKLFCYIPGTCAQV